MCNCLGSLAEVRETITLNCQLIAKKCKFAASMPDADELVVVIGYAMQHGLGCW